jgi:predicted dehydrogenase
MRFGGFDGVFQASAHELKGTNRLEIAGTKGRLVIGSRKMVYRLFKQSEYEVNEKTKVGYGNTKAKTYRLCYGIKLIRDLLYGQQQNILNNFANAINKGDKSLLLSPASEGINALSLINGIYMSNWLGKEIELPINGDDYDKLLLEHINKEIKTVENL